MCALVANNMMMIFLYNNSCQTSTPETNGTMFKRERERGDHNSVVETITTTHHSLVSNSSLLYKYYHTWNDGSSSVNHVVHQLHQISKGIINIRAIVGYNTHAMVVLRWLFSVQQIVWLQLSFTRHACASFSCRLPPGVRVHHYSFNNYGSTKYTLT